MENKINETIVEGRKFRRLINKEANTLERFSGWYVTDRPFECGILMDVRKIMK